MRQVTVIVRLVLNKQGLIAHGELVDPEGELLSRFVGLRGLNRSLRKWLASPKLRDSDADLSPGDTVSKCAE